MKKQSKKFFEFPTTIVLLFMIMIAVLILTWIVPSGQFERIELDGRTVVVPDSYTKIDNNPQNIFSLFTAIPKGFKEVESIVFFIFVVGGAFYIINETGIINAWLKKIIKVFNGKEYLAITIIMLVLGFAGTTIGLKEETLMMIPLGIAMANAFGFDDLTGVAMISLGAAFGFYTAVINPFSLGIAQEIAELPLFSGIKLRLIMFVVYWIITSSYVVIYARKIKKNPNKYIDANLIFEEQKSNVEPNNFILWSVTLVVLSTFAIILFGVFKYDWFIVEIGACFLIMSLICGLLNGKSFNQVSDSMIIGMGELIEPAMVVVFARAILVIMEDGLILDTIVNYLTNIVSGFPGIIAAMGFYVIQILINFVIPASTGQAATTMPIMTPIADSVGITRQTAVLAYMLGSGFMDSIIPTAGVLMAQLSIGKIDYKRWVKFAAPLVAIWMLVGVLFLGVAYYIGYGPF